jgi:uncharacterized coiled-coil protein SlyX
MAKSIGPFPGLTLFLAGVATGILTGSAKRRSASAAPDPRLKSEIDELKKRAAAQEAATVERFSRMEAKLDEHAARFADVPSTTQIASAMEKILARAMSSLDDRLNTQAHSIETLKNTVAQTDGLLERVLESLDALHPASPESGYREDMLGKRQS